MKTLLWLQGLSCNGNTQSLLNAENPTFYELFEQIKLLYHPSISYSIDIFDIINEIKNDRTPLTFLVIEGSITSDKRFFKIGDLSISQIINQLKEKADYIIAVGNCASFGNIPSTFDKNPDVTGLQFRFQQKEGLLPKEFKSKKGYPVINITGCPIHPSWFSLTVLNLLYGKPILLDEFNRPKELYMYLTHDGCTRNEYFEWKEEMEEFGHKEGCLFYNQGCKGPLTHAPCNKILWNSTSSKTRAGMPCLACTEFDFPLRENFFETKKNMGIPEEVPLGVSKRAYITITGIAKTLGNERVRKKLEETD